MKIGIFGGSFNPPHNMHKNIALKLITDGYLDKVIYVPTGDSYNKKDLISFKDRYSMVSLMISSNDNLSVSDIENSECHQYTYQVLDYFRKLYPFDEIYFICGSDNLNEFYTWKRYEYILENYKLLVIGRNNDNMSKILSRYSKYSDRIIVSDMGSNELSSTYLRSNINSDDIKWYLDEKVYNYIRKNSLYFKKNRDYRLQRGKNKVIISVRCKYD